MVLMFFCTLQAAKAADLVKDPEHEKIVCTKWKEDGQIYRAKITCVMTEEKKVKETNQSINQSVSQSVNQSISQSVNQIRLTA